MTNLEKQLQQLEKLKVQIAKEKDKINTTVGKKLIEALDIPYETLTPQTIDQLVKKLVTLHEQQTTKCEQQL
ncbi:MAG: hypothetical protein UHX00_01250 [Caryophanon sp.]|nr:hypothetical protein [Caryophanon sp.]